MAREVPIHFTFMSHPTPELSIRWQAVVTLPVELKPETALPIEVADGNGEPVAEATFEFAGRRLKVKDGKASITYAEFLKGKSNTALWLYRKGHWPIPGGLTFA